MIFKAFNMICEVFELNRELDNIDVSLIESRK